MSDSKRKNGTFIHGIASSEHLDSSGERIKIEGVDISSLTKDGNFNYEHSSKEASSIVGKIFEAKKILKRSDCESEHQKYFWDKIKMPYIYVAGELFDAVGHKEASEVAAMVRYDQLAPINKEAKKLINFSIEGSRMEKQGSTITKCIARKISITLTPCNKVCEAEELKQETKEEKHPDSGKFSFIQDIMDKSDEPSCQIMKGENPYLYKSKDTPVKMTAEEAVDEHEHLIDVLESPSKKDDKKEAKKQGKELKEYKEKLNKAAKPVNSKDPVLNYGKMPPKAMDSKQRKKYEERSKILAEKTKVEKGTGLPGEFKPHYATTPSPREARKLRHGVMRGVINAQRERIRNEQKQKAQASGALDADTVKLTASEKPAKNKLSKYDSNVRKALTASCGMGSSSAKVQGEALAKEDEPAKPTGTTEAYHPKGKKTPVGKLLRLQDLKDYKKLPKPNLPKSEIIKTEHKKSLPLPKFFENHKGVIPHNHPDRPKAIEPKKANKKPIKEAKITQPKEEKKPFTFHGATVKPNPKIKFKTQADLDPDKGILNTPGGSFKLHYPHHEDEQYQQILNSPDIQDIHSNAMKNWFMVHNLVKSGVKLPEELIAHGNAFSILSANTPVPSQELSYSRLVDALKERNVPMHSPQIAEEFARKGPGRAAWHAKDSPTELPEHSREYWAGKARPAITQTAYSEGTGRDKGDIISLGATDAFSDRLAKYPNAHNYLTALLQGYGPDARSVVSLMMAAKANPQLPDTHPMKQGMGLGTKTGRYAAAMLGGGNIVVPDTHFIRHSFGLDQNKDSKSIDYLKSLLWDPKNFHLLNTLDEHYQQNHPAVKFIQNKYFGGKEDPNAIFPAFWLHWLSIAPHEKAQGIGKPYASKNLTDHTPFWDTAKQILHKHGLLDIKKSENQKPLHQRTAEASAELEERLGAVPASMIYYSHIVPQLMGKFKSSPKTRQISRPVKKPIVDRQDQINPPEMGKSEMQAIMKKLGDQAFERFEKKEELIAFLSEKLPKLSEKEIKAIAKAVAYTSEKKKEEVLKSLVGKDAK